MWDNTCPNSCGVGGGWGTSARVSKINKMFIERRRRGGSGRPGANHPLARGEQSDPRTAENALNSHHRDQGGEDAETNPKPIVY